MTKTILVLHLFFFLGLIGCVGTVEEVTPPGSLKLDKPVTTFNFSGITTARAISHNKVELEFYPAGNSNFIYKLFINNSTTPVTIDPKALYSASGGKLLYTVKELIPDRDYKFKITAIDPTTNKISQNENEAFARTYDNVVADFDGVSQVSLIPGSTSSAVKVDWIVPKMTGIFTSGPHDPVRYEVSFISEIGGVGNLNNPNYRGTDRREPILIPMPPAAGAGPLDNPSYLEVTGLAANTRYYFQVRAIHFLYDFYQFNPDFTSIPVSREMNTRILSIKTDPAGSLFDFRQDNVILKNASGVDAFDKIDVFWQPGSGSFSNYRIFIRKYDGISDAAIDDKLNEPTLHSMNLNGDFKAVSSTKTSLRIDALENYSWYQVKVALCKTISCPVQSSDPNAAIISDLRAIQIQPTLASFSGINNIEQPGQFSQKDVVKLRFDAPLIKDGFATHLEFYCVNPSDHSQMVKLDSSPLADSTITKCNGLFLDGTSPLATFTSQKVRGVITDGATEYCFAATPAIIGYGDDVRLNPANRIVRCVYPEILPPSVAQFPGLKNSCQVSGTSGYVEWNLPTGGIYSGFKVFWKEKTSSNKFSFPEATKENINYLNSGNLSADTKNFVAQNLIPGKTYQIGVLATVDMDLPVPDLYSEYNLNVFECVVPLPIATFKGFTRIFAIGPKMDGRIPNDPSTTAPPVSGSNNSLIYEAINQDGIPFEVAMDTSSVPNILLNYTPPPGRDAGSSFNSGFDGATESDFGYGMSRKGIVSLAWEEVEMNFPEADVMFASNQPASPAARSGRKYGYKVFRSHDNKLTWRELTGLNGPVYSMNYTYYNRPNSSPITDKKMAFFTDYSVQALYEVHDETKEIDIDRARTYYYKIVPVFDGQNLNYTENNHHIVRVTLPPPNMALVHRWMANRHRCLELDKEILIGEDYSCVYNGIGSTPKSIPHRVGDTVLDQGGDLLVDRQELGCRYTRGEKTSAPLLGLSNFSLPATYRRHPNDINEFPLFKGFSTQDGNENTTSPFRGCVGELLPNAQNLEYSAGFVPEYQRYLHGDCLGAHNDRIPNSSCSATAFSEGRYSIININIPGASINPLIEDCSESNLLAPTNADQRYSGYSAPNFVMQSEFLGVYYNSSLVSQDGVQYHGRFLGPNTGDLTSSRQLNNNSINSGFGSSSCSINLAAIGADGNMMPRWLSINELSVNRVLFKGSYQPIINKTVSEISEVAAATSEPLTFYNGHQGDVLSTASFKLPSENLRKSSRYRNTTRLAKIMTSNSAKLPPLGKLSPEVSEIICSNYYVQTGIASDNGNFAPDSAVKQKRLLRRVESVASNAWPDSFNTTKIAQVENSNFEGSCVNTAKALNAFTPSRGGVLRNSLPVSTNLENTTLVTGSSRYNGLASYSETNHSEKCISRYGIQDLIGNQSENNSERIFCDYTQDQINIGPVTGSWGGASQAENTGAGGPDYPFFNSNDERNRWAVLKRGFNNLNQPVQFQFKFLDDSPSRSDVAPWVRVSTDSGYCSIVDGNPAKRSGLENFFRNNIYWTSIFSPGGSTNPAIIERTQTDQEAVSTWRNGDGRFLDFGPRGIGAPISKANTLALSGATARSKYFNPVIGLPLQCSNFSCNDSILGVDQNDNTAVTIPTLRTNIVSEVDDEAEIIDFPIGNSEITNTGVADYTFDPLGFSTTTVPTSGGGTGGIGQYLSGVTFNDPVTLGNPSPQIMNFPQDFKPGSELEYYRVIWTVERGAEFALVSGGNSSNSRTGRYTASMSVSGIGTSAYGTNEFNRGARCAVMINQD